MESVYTTLTARALDIQRQSRQNSLTRVVIAFAGPPGSGKSTIAAEVVRRINAQTNHPIAVVLPMDGFHHSRAYLDTLPNRNEACARRGIYWTFDADGVLKLVKALHSSRSISSDVILAPSFDHKSKDPVADALRIDSEAEIVIVEGNWLLLDRDPWRQVSDYVDDTWFVDVEPKLARQRVAARHIRSGIETNWEAAILRAEGNDLLNGDEVRTNLIRPNVIVQSVEDEKHRTRWEYN
ncbi:P-loop containing nucleoside triphosphate hydrolase protein [Dactylonectria macrodidyma]|uniref:P-loop containing nucleoside triphosphate hydrolase protein n=1 Tax=Dactylonectria macrodidyma TaxID=307937 RepID=A0A9P9F8N6_9HYPO|nr:P-loop containing nucleoside triphosphate hydrolase protein [Dactylonectria macrodidyma]